MTDFIEHIVLFLNLLQEIHVVVLLKEYLLELLNCIFLCLLNFEMVNHVVVDQSKLFKHFVKHLSHVIFFFDDVQSFSELFCGVLSLISFQLQYIESHFAQFNGVQLCAKRICCLSDEAVLVTFVIMLLVNHVRSVVLVVLWIHIEEIDSVNINFINVLKVWISSRNTNITLLVETVIALAVDA